MVGVIVADRGTKVRVAEVRKHGLPDWRGLYN